MLDARAVKERGGLNLCWGEWMKWQWKLGMWKRDESGKGDREGEGEGEEGERGEITNILTGVEEVECVFFACCARGSGSQPGCISS